ncbi:MAG: hypothetical protein H6581_11175 [Bacteroidia bacterium]|nr:hypothetical protein [Bacteroidia bacterium]
MRNRIYLAILTLGAFMVSCNPFAPAYDEDGLVGQNVLGNRKSVDGFFQYFKNSYELRDTSLYGRILTHDFRFTYFDFDQNANVTWDKETELALSYNLFRGVQQITLDWNFYVDRDTSDTLGLVVRNFTLNIVENENSIYSGSGRARLSLRRSTPYEPWMLYDWFDDSDF